ncbi:transcriptional regulator, IclR family [Bryocella elongata]|uniref:Transcriptional regulator, IclR family n=1 Tax=Bryocella elongata TaxID=863522 RepID=A0A1H5ZMY2_9BACT|nr:IclR family transcriptional regulator C-terminal domain-containing protein [Bryocella elongata]SEG37561.1 transcriptional regulator, IclR family [Bryocella elongata]
MSSLVAAAPAAPLPLHEKSTASKPVLPGVALEAYSGDPNFMASLARGLVVIEAFTPQSPQMTISQLSQRTGLSRAAVRRCLYTLVKLGFAGADEAQRYSLRPKMLTLANTYTASSTLANAAQPILERMSASYKESFSVATLDGEEIVYIARTTMTRVMSVDLHIGSRLPAFCTSMGRVLLAYLPQDQLEHFLARLQLVQYTPRTVNSKEKLRLILRNVRRNGYALCDQEYEVGLRSIAVPVFAGNGRVVATVNLSGHAPRMPMLEMQTRFLPPLRAAASELSVFLR